MKHTIVTPTNSPTSAPSAEWPSRGPLASEITGGLFVKKQHMFVSNAGTAFRVGRTDVIVLRRLTALIVGKALRERARE